jgi:hypothetical protein
MPRTRLFHKKNRNVGLIYEFLVRILTNDVMEGNERFKSVARIIKQNFNKDSELLKELQIYQTLSESTVEKFSEAKQILRKIIEVARRLDENKINEELNNVFAQLRQILPNISEMRKNVKIKNYRTLASVQQILEYERTPEKFIKFMPVIMSVEDNLLKEMVSRYKVDSVIEEKIDIDPITYYIIVEKFNNKYKDFLPTQKETLNRFILSGNNKNEFKDYIKEEFARISAIIAKHKKLIKDKENEKVLEIKLSAVDDVIKDILKNKETLLRENNLAVLLGLQKLENELLLKEQTYTQTVGSKIKLETHIDDGTKKEPKTLTIGYTFSITLKETNSNKNNAQPGLAAADAFKSAAKQFIQNSLYPATRNMPELNIDDFISRYPDRCYDFPDGGTSPMTFFKIGKKIKVGINVPAMIRKPNALTFEELQKKIINYFGSPGLLNHHVFVPLQNDPWEIS